ncbi:hypothetical protein AB0I98_13720 [Streptomyces sp. NPDC050211]|uniref:hypothetical protein n=1 Tax=Streptomyces sp. NPDC050211 TaxID=3154932 RepID=UPI0034188925
MGEHAVEVLLPHLVGVAIANRALTWSSAARTARASSLGVGTSMELEPDLAARLEDPDTWDGNELTYLNNLSYAPGSKVGGWLAWGLTDPEPDPCPACEARMTPLLTIASTEWTDESASWTPLEDRGTSPTPAMLQVGDAVTLQLYACPTDPRHPHQARVQ